MKTRNVRHRQFLRYIPRMEKLVRRPSELGLLRSWMRFNGYSEECIRRLHSRQREGRWLRRPLPRITTPGRTK